MVLLIIFCIIFFTFGVIVGLFISNTNIASKQYDAYQEGFMDGYNEVKNK